MMTSSTEVSIECAKSRSVSAETWRSDPTMQLDTMTDRGSAGPKLTHLAKPKLTHPIVQY